MGNRVREARKRAHITQEKLSEKLIRLGASIDRAGVAKIEAGIRGVLDFEIIALSKALNVGVTWLLGVKE